MSTKDIIGLTFGAAIFTLILAGAVFVGAGLGRLDQGMSRPSLSPAVKP